MNFKRFTNSLATRLVFLGVLMVALGGIARYSLLSDFLRENLIEVVSAQQTALAEAVAQDIDYKLVERRNLLEGLAKTLPRELLADPARLRAWLGERYQINPLFSLGLLVATADGRITTDFPPLPGRSGVSIAGEANFSAARAGRTGIGTPRIGTFSNRPVLPMGTPIRDDRGRVIGVLIGLTALDAPNFLDRIVHGRIGKTGGFVLISPQDKLFVAASQPEMALKPTPLPGINLLHDKAMNGFRGSGVTVNAYGVEEISAMVSVPSAGWFVAARLPTAEALTTVGKTQSFILRHGMTAALVVLFCAGLLIRLMLRPLYSAAETAEKMTQGLLPLEPLPVIRDDEVGHLTTAFNRLLGKLASTQAKLARMAHHDSLTGLPNRALLADRMQQALSRAARNGNTLAVLFLDLDGFKRLNDQMGHEAGDSALKELARRLSAELRQTDTLARVGGDEFVILVTDLPSAASDGLRVLAERCLATVARPLPEMPGCVLGVSIGIVLSDGHGTPERLLAAADQAMYAAKSQGRNCYVFAPHPAA